MRRKREKYVERESQRAIRSNVERDKILLERDKILLERLDHLRENQRKVEKVKSEKKKKKKKKKKEKETLRT
jgi:hypothetical protein